MNNTMTRPGVEPGPLAPESSALTMRPPCLPPYSASKTPQQELWQSHLGWPNTVFARAFADAIQRAHKAFKKQTFRQESDNFIYLTPALSVLFFSIIERSVLMVLVFHYKDMFSFCLLRKNSVECNACAVARKIETDCFKTYRFLKI